MIKTISNLETKNYNKVMCYIDNDIKLPNDDNFYLITQKNKNEKLLCECGKFYKKYSYKSHIKSKFHNAHINNTVITHRVCKKCNENKEINNFQLTSKINKPDTYRYECKKCYISNKKDYMQDYHKTHYEYKKKSE
jgi:hypothetical protein